MCRLFVGFLILNAPNEGYWMEFAVFGISKFQCFGSFRQKPGNASKCIYYAESFHSPKSSPFTLQNHFNTPPPPISPSLALFPLSFNEHFVSSFIRKPLKETGNSLTTTHVLDHLVFYIYFVFFRFEKKVLNHISIYVTFFATLT